jgi:hypothetical protein
LVSIGCSTSLCMFRSTPLLALAHTRERAKSPPLQSRPTCVGSAQHSTATHASVCAEHACDRRIRASQELTSMVDSDQHMPSPAVFCPSPAPCKRLRWRYSCRSSRHAACCIDLVRACLSAREPNPVCGWRAWPCLVTHHSKRISSWQQLLTSSPYLGEAAASISMALTPIRSVRRQASK